MKPETLKLLRQELKAVSDPTLCQFAIAVISELEGRGVLPKRIRKWDGHWISKDCNPNPES